MDPDDLIARYGDVQARPTKRETLAPDRWESARTREDHETAWGVGALVEADDSVLLVKQGNKWFLPGGMHERGETHADGALREVREETGVTVEITDLLAVTDQTFVHAEDGREFAFRFATFRGEPADTTLATDPGIEGETIDDVAWREALPENTFDRDLVAQLRD
ncbi:MAG: NUDIX domain-containing protein [Halobacteriales archaeon]|nr:NUDIX domain-containing protein [Halobacteriales archaeon]